MVDATISCVRLRGLDALGRSRRVRAGAAAANPPCAARRRTGTDGAAIAAGTSPHPSTPSPRPGTDDLVASTICARRYFHLKEARCVVPSTSFTIRSRHVPATYADTTLLDRLTGFRPSTPVTRGVAEFVTWYREYYGI